MDKNQIKEASLIENQGRRQFLQKAAVGALAAAPVAGALAASRPDSAPQNTVHSETALAPEAWMAA